MITTTDLLTGLVVAVLCAILYPACMALFLIIAGRHNRAVASEES